MLLSNLSPVQLRNTSGNLLRVLHPHGLIHQSEKSHGWESQTPTDGDQTLSSTHHPPGEAPPCPLLVSCIIQSPESAYGGPDGVLHKVWECLQAGQTSNKKQNGCEHTCREQRRARCCGSVGLRALRRETGALWALAGRWRLQNDGPQVSRRRRRCLFCHPLPPECKFWFYWKDSFYVTFKAPLHFLTHLILETTGRINRWNISFSWNWACSACVLVHQVWIQLSPSAHCFIYTLMNPEALYPLSFYTWPMFNNY